MRIRLTITFLLVAIVFLVSCKRKEKIKTVNEFNAFLSNTENGYKIIKSVNGVLISVIYMPPEYVTLKEVESSGVANKKHVYDSLLNQNKASASFVMILGPDESKNNKDDIMYKNLKDFKEYVARALELNFDLESKVELQTEKYSFHPVLSSLENTYSLSTDRKINFVFVPLKDKKELEEVKHFDFVYSDETFKIGILHFEFDKHNLESRSPEISLGN